MVAGTASPLLANEVSTQRKVANPAANFLRGKYNWYHKKQLKGLVVPMPTVVKAPSGEEVVVCLNRKVASSRWNQLFLKSSGWDPDNVTLEELHTAVYRYDGGHWAGLRLWEGIDGPETYVDKVLREHRNRSFIFVRNPYVRLLSGFLHVVTKVIRSKRCFVVCGDAFSVCPLPDNDSSEVQQQVLGSPRAFAAFVRDLHSFHAAGMMGRADIHIKPLSLQCGLQHGLRYSFILKLEEEHQWYPELVKFLGMEELVASGWAKFNAPEEEFHRDLDCFYRPTWMTCSEMNQTIHAAVSEKECNEAGGRGTTGAARSANDLLQEDPGINERPEHRTAAAAKLARFYTPEIAEMVRKMFRRDFELFGYNPVLTLSGNTP